MSQSSQILTFPTGTIGNATEQKPARLYINPRQVAIVRRAFDLYASDTRSDTTIAE